MIFKNPIFLDLSSAHSYSEFESILTNNEENLESLLLELLPETITKPCETFQQSAERQPFVYSVIAGLSSLMVKVSTEYAGKKVYPMIYFALIGPAGSNKGIVKYAAIMLKPVHLEFKLQSDEQFSRYRVEYRKFQKAVKSNPELTEPIKPPYKVVLVSADITKSKLIQQLHDNENVPTFMINDEIDTLLASTRGQYGGGISSILRTAYHHDLISQQLKGENQHYEIDEPKLAICLAGTPAQMLGLIENIENGLYSRFTILLTDGFASWNSVAPCSDCPDKEETFKFYSDEVLKLYHSIKNRNIVVEFSDMQWRMINDFGEKQLLKYTSFYNEQMGSVVKRHGLMIVKIAMLLTVVRAYEKGNSSDVLECDMESFVAAMILGVQSLYNSAEFFKTFPKGKQTEAAKNNQILLDVLPMSFTRAEAIVLGETKNISIRSIDRALHQMEHTGILKKISHGNYEKTEIL